MKEPEGTKPATCEAAEERAEGYDQASYIPREIIASRAKHCLKRPYGTGAKSSGTGVAIQTWDADGFGVAFVDGPLKETFHIGIGDKRGSKLDHAPGSPDKAGE